MKFFIEGPRPSLEREKDYDFQGYFIKENKIVQVNIYMRLDHKGMSQMVEDYETGHCYYSVFKSLYGEILSGHSDFRDAWIRFEFNARPIAEFRSDFERSQKAFSLLSKFAGLIEDLYKPEWLSVDQLKELSDLLPKEDIVRLGLDLANYADLHQALESSELPTEVKGALYQITE